ncbi:hypothetical protein B0H14DRAFT_2629257 [Mycena olivaceomarginata]|nr:hypothetical protein B0H14DRAFT_2629257 [Mycena olivaceomarginata]
MRENAAAQDDEEEDEREDDADGSQGADERGLVYKAVVGGRHEGGKRRGEEGMGGKRKRKMHKLLLPPLPFAAAALDPDPAPDPELDPEPEPSVGTAVGALVAAPKRVFVIVCICVWLSVPVTTVAAGGPGASPSQSRLGLLPRLWVKTPGSQYRYRFAVCGGILDVLAGGAAMSSRHEQRKSMAHLAGVGHGRSVASVCGVLNAHLGGQYLMKYSFLPSVVQLHPLSGDLIAWWTNVRRSRPIRGLFNTVVTRAAPKTTIFYVIDRVQGAVRRGGEDPSAVRIPTRERVERGEAMLLRNTRAAGTTLPRRERTAEEGGGGQEVLYKEYGTVIEMGPAAKAKTQANS